MAFTESWVETDPDGAVITVSQLDDYQRQAKRAIRERIESFIDSINTDPWEAKDQVHFKAASLHKGAVTALGTTGSFTIVDRDTVVTGYTYPAPTKPNWLWYTKGGITRLHRDAVAYTITDADAATIAEGDHFSFIGTGLLGLSGSFAGIEMSDRTTYTKRFFTQVDANTLTFGRVEKNGAGFYGDGGNVGGSVKNWLNVSFATQEAKFVKDVVLETGILKTNSGPYAKYGFDINTNPIADGGTIVVAAYGAGGILVVVADATAAFVTAPTAHTVNLLDDAVFGGLFSTVKDTANRINVYQENGVGLVIQNKRGGPLNMGYFFSGIG